ncbi:MAG: chromosome condensation regulator [Hyperionvirus sp.]|uniref:Chromosome condensation regulator n=1 Tax=Hyperionvirus sp. TaxID=2487770 RepID=A0A3G5A688_9VIRU|nr:MAG: chromosome condensation regulator [Hyperionvirus sp.]
MKLKSLIKALPKELQYMVTNYDPTVLFCILSKSELTEYDWFKLIRMNFSLCYQRDECTNEEIMEVYLNECYNGNKSMIFQGEYYTIVRLNECTLMSSGYNYVGQLGLGDHRDRYGFQKISGINIPIVEVACGKDFIVIRLMDGTLMGCGCNESGQLGFGDYKNRNKFEEIKNIGKNIVEVKCAYSYTIIRFGDGILMGCGSNEHGQLGLGDRLKRNVFEKIDSVPKNIVEVISGTFNVIVRLTDGTLMATGYNDHGELGLGDKRNRYGFVKVGGIGKNIAKVFTGCCNTAILLTDGTLLVSGYNQYGQLGLGDKRDRMSFEKITGIPKNIRKVVWSQYHAFIILTNGTLMGCGFNSSGQLGLGDHECLCFFEEVKGVPKNIEEVTTRNSHTIIRLMDGKLMSCGSNVNGELGLGDFIGRKSFEGIKGVPKNISEVVFPMYGTLIRLTDGTMMGCGCNIEELGFGDYVKRNVFTKL